jgi:hypothetical protein
VNVVPSSDFVDVANVVEPSSFSTVSVVDVCVRLFRASVKTQFKASFTVSVTPGTADNSERTAAHTAASADV